MAITALTDLDFNSQSFADMLGGEFTTTLEARSSGIVAPIPNGMIPDGTPGQFMNLPQWDTLDNSTTQITDTSSAPSAGAQTSWKTYAPYISREQAWGSGFLPIVQAALDPMAEVARQFAHWMCDVVLYWSGGATIGAFTTALNTTHSTGTTYEGGAINIQGAIAAKKLLGDNQRFLKECLMHGYVNSNAVRDGILTTLPNNQGAYDLYRSGAVSQLVGSNVSLDDSFCAADASSIYPTYFAAPGAVVFHSRKMPVSSQSFSSVSNVSSMGINLQVEKSRSQASGGADILTARLDFAVAVKGLEWQTTGNPSYASLSTGSNWSKSTGIDDKNIRIVRLTTAVTD